MKKILTLDNIIPAAMLAFLGWVGVQSVTSKEAIASLQQAQLEDQRVNKIVYQFEKVLPKIESQLTTIEKGVQSNALSMNAIRDVQQDSNLRIYCVSTFPVGEKRKDCIDKLIEE